MSLKGSKTEEIPAAAFAGESQATDATSTAQKADVEGYNDVSALFCPPRKAKPTRSRTS